MAKNDGKKNLKWFTERIGKKIACTHPKEALKELTIQSKNHALQLYGYGQSGGWRFDDKNN